MPVTSTRSPAANTSAVDHLAELEARRGRRRAARRGTSAAGAPAALRWPSSGLLSRVGLGVAERELHRGVAVALGRLELHDATRPGLDDGHRNRPGSRRRRPGSCRACGPGSLCSPSDSLVVRLAASCGCVTRTLRTGDPRRSVGSVVPRGSLPNWLQGLRGPRLISAGWAVPAECRRPENLRMIATREIPSATRPICDQPGCARASRVYSSGMGVALVRTAASGRRPVLDHPGVRGPVDARSCSTSAGQRQARRRSRPGRSRRGRGSTRS